MRPGRLDRILYVGPPDIAGREEILRIRMKTMTVGPDVNVRSIAELVSVGLSSGSFFLLICNFAIRQTDALEQKYPPCVKKLLSLPCKKIWRHLMWVLRCLKMHCLVLTVYRLPRRHLSRLPSRRKGKSRPQCCRNSPDGEMEAMHANFEEYKMYTSLQRCFNAETLNRSYINKPRRAASCFSRTS